MSVFTLQANHHLAVAYTAPWIGQARYQVESERPITILVVDEANLAAWRSGKPYNAFGGNGTTTQAQQAVTIPARSTWYLVMVNYDLARPTAVYYNVQS